MIHVPSITWCLVISTTFMLLYSYVIVRIARQRGYDEGVSYERALQQVCNDIRSTR